MSRRTLLAALAAVVLTITVAGGTHVAARGVAIPRAIEAIISKSVYARSIWGILVVDLSTGRVLIDQLGEKMFVPGSIFKVYSVASLLDVYGPEYRFETPVYRTGDVADGALTGDVILVAAADFSFGLREQPDGTLAFNNFPQIDHNYADTGLPGPALVPNSHPLAGVDDLAAQVRAAGIREVRGNVVVDDRLFNTYSRWPDGLISPIWVNENVVDITTTPTAPGQAAGVDWRPRTATYEVVSEVTTVAGEGTPLTVDSPRPGVIRITGQISVSSPPILSIWQVEDPASFARTAFIEALQRAGVTVRATATGKNPSDLLPPSNTAYTPARLVAKRVSPPLSEYAKVILKTSYNRGADLALCLLAVRAGSRDCAVGLVRELDILTRYGVSATSTILFDGAGSDERDRTSPVDMVTFLGAISRTPWGRTFRTGLPILGVDGDLATTGAGTPAAGKVQAKTGSRAAIAPTDQGIITALTLAGYADTAAGRQVGFAIFLRDLAFRSFDEFFAARDDQGAIAVAIQQAY
jgi:D-alanyl-D-alanine carboxypeptidase/D-alanyl-D-alanine-endopeptidase (penicillin-binding protein 4)